MLVGHLGSAFRESQLKGKGKSQLKARRVLARNIHFDSKMKYLYDLAGGIHFAG